MSASTSRVKRYRERQKRRTHYTVAETPSSLVAYFITAGYLTEPEAFDARKIGDAMVRYMLEQKKKLLP